MALGTASRSIWRRIDDYKFVIVSETSASRREVTREQGKLFLMYKRAIGLLISSKRIVLMQPRMAGKQAAHQALMGLLGKEILTKGERQVLQRLANGEELDEFTPGGWWIDTDKIDGRIGWNLLRKMALHQEMYTDESHRIYTINETGKQLLESTYETNNHPKR